MEIDIKAINFDADIYDVRKALGLILHGPDLYDPKDPINKGRKPNFEVVLGESPAGGIHNGTGIPRVPINDSGKNKIFVKGRALRLFRATGKVSQAKKQLLEKALYVDPEKEKQRKDIESRAREARFRVAKIQFGVWHRQLNSPPTNGRAFSIEYERDFLSKSAAYISVVYEHKLIRIDIGQREIEEIDYIVLVKFSSIRKLGIGNDECGHPFIVFDLHVPSIFEGKSYNARESGDRPRRRRDHKTRDRLIALDDAHAGIAPYAHHLRVVLFEQDSLPKFEKICHLVDCQPSPIRVAHVDADSFQFFSPRNLYHVERWIKTMDWKNAFQIEACLRDVF